MSGWGESAIWLGAGAAAVLAGQPAAEAADWMRAREHVLGTSLRMAAQGADEADAKAAFAAAQSEIARLDAVLSGWREDSELAALNRSEKFQASPDLFAVIAACERWRERSFGAYCARQGAIEAAWRAAARDGVEPSRARLSAMASLIGSRDIGLDPAMRMITRPADVRFAVDGLAKGYIIDAALEAALAAAPSLEGVMIEIGGDLRVWGDAPDPQGWRVGVADTRYDNTAPLMNLRVRDKALATSGPGARDYAVAGRTVSHLISPFTGWAIARPNYASAAADRAADADALATALSVLPPYEGLKLAARTPGAEALITDGQGGSWMSPGWSALAFDLAAPPCQAAAPAPPWPSGYALSVRYEIPRIAAGDYERPYVVAWISDQNRQLVRTLAVIGDRARWRESNYIWWRRFERFSPEAVQAISRPTRAPGRYDLLWDGRDDEGRLLGQGRYTLTIEAAREHGGHSVQTIDLDLGAAPVQQDAPAQGELGALSVRYGDRR